MVEEGKLNGQQERQRGYEGCYRNRECELFEDIRKVDRYSGVGSWSRGGR